MGFEIYKSENECRSFNVPRIGRLMFRECSENATDALPQDSRNRMDSGRHIYPSQSALVPL